MKYLHYVPRAEDAALVAAAFAVDGPPGEGTRAPAVVTASPDQRA